MKKKGMIAMKKIIFNQVLLELKEKSNETSNFIHKQIFYPT